jgi:hypothetical protein
MQIAVKRLQPAVCNHVSNLKPKLNQLTKLEKAMNRTYRSFIASLVLLVLFGVITGCRETPINTNPVPRGSQIVGEINGVVRDGNTGAPLSGVTLRLIGPDGDLTTTTNADGIYVFRNLQVGTYKITAAAPSGYAPTRTRNVAIAAPANPGTGVNIVRAALDIRFFTANAAFSATLQYQTPDGRLLPVPAGTPVFINFVKQVSFATGLEETVGDVQVALVRDSVRANGAVSITGLPAVGALSQASPAETPRFIVPTFTVDGVTYGNPDGKALEYRIAGLRPGVTFVLPPAVATITIAAATLPLSLSATNMNSRTNFGTTDTIFVAFNKPISTFSFSLFRTRTPYIDFVSTSSTEDIASTAAGSLIATALPAGAVPQLGGTIVGANQAFAIRLNRPFVTGSEHRLDLNVTAADGTTLSLVGAAGGAVGARTFTTVPGIRLLSVTAGNVTLSPTTTTVGVPTSGTITFTFDRPPVGQYFTRGPLRNVRFASGSDNPRDARDELGRVGIRGEINRIDCVGVITGNSLSFGYRNLVGPAPNDAVGTTYLIHASEVDLGPADQPISKDAVAPGTLGNFRSAIPGDFGVVAVLRNNRASEFSSLRAFTAAVRDINIPRIVSAAVPANPDDSVRITFTRPMRLSVGQRFTEPDDNIRMFRSRTAQPYGPPRAFPTGPTNPIRLRISSISSSGDTTTYFLVRDERRDVDGAAIPFEGNTAYTLEISADLTSADGVRLRGERDRPPVFTFSGRTAGQQFAGATVGGVAIAGENTRVPTSGNIELRFTRPILQNVDYRTRGLKQNFELVRISRVDDPGASDFSPTDLGPNPTTVFIDATGTKTANTITFGYRGLYRNTRYALRAISPPPADFFRTDVTLAQIPDSAYNVRWADFPNDPGVGFRPEYNDATGNRLDVQFVTQEAEPARLIASNTDANPTAFPLVIDSAVQTSLTNPIRLTFSKEMERNPGDAFTLTAVASPYFRTPYDVRLKATWNRAGTEVSLVPREPVRGDTARTLEAGTTYELTINTSRIRAVDGGALVPLIRPITFTTQPETRLVDVKVNDRSFLADPGFPINAGDTVGTITLTFSKNIGGRYNVRGPLRRFVIIEDSSGTDLSSSMFDATATSDGTAASVTDTTRAALVDSLSVVNNNTLTIRYRISRQRLRGRGVINNPIGPAVPQNQNRIIRFSLKNTIFGGPNGEDYNNLNTEPSPQNIRGFVRGDLGVRGKALPPEERVTSYTPSADFGTFPRPTLEPDKYLNDRPALERFGPGNVGVTEFAFYFSTGGTPTSQSFPDLVISSVRNAAESVSQAAKQTVSTVRSWWKRFRGE